MDLSKVGRGGLAGVLSAMDGAKQGTQERLLPSPANPPRPAITRPCSRCRCSCPCLQAARTRKQTSPAIDPHMNRLALTETLTWSAP